MRILMIQPNYHSGGAEIAGEVSACGAPTHLPNAPESSAAKADTEEEIQIVIVDGDEPSRIALRKGLRAQPGIEVASEATNGETGLVLLDSIVVDVVVVDATLPDMAIATFIQRVREQETRQPFKLLILTPDQTHRSDLDHANVTYCPKESSMASLADQIYRLHKQTSLPMVQVSLV